MSACASFACDTESAIQRIRAVVRAELAAPLPESVRELADRARNRYGDAVVAVLYYGSCLREGLSARALADLYVLGTDYRALHRHLLARLANRLLPPNVYYFETELEGERLRAKCALLSLPHFERKLSPRAQHPYFWARFAQPVGLAWARDGAVRGRIEAALAQAITTFYGSLRPLLPQRCDARTFWTRAFRATYATELRAERPQRAEQLFERFRPRYETLFEILETARAGLELEARRSWRFLRLEGKLLSLARLAKAAFTFEGGADYLAWKISRHTGTPVDLTPFQRRHPLLAGVPLALRLARRGLIR